MANLDSKTSDTYILGHAFLRNYLSIYDAKSKQVGLAIHTLSNAAVRATFSGGIIALIAISVAIIFPLFVLGLYFGVLAYKKKKKARIAAEKSQLETNNLSSALRNSDTHEE